jgi:hypothetical protein
MALTTGATVDYTTEAYLKAHIKLLKENLTEWRNSITDWSQWQIKTRIHGQEALKLLIEPEEGPDSLGRYDQLVKVAEHIGYKVESKKLGFGVAGQTSHTNDLIQLSNTLSPLDKVHTIAHELAHAVLHEEAEKVFGKNQPDGFDVLNMIVGTYPEETYAECTSWIVCDIIGVDVHLTCYPYIIGWATNDGTGDLKEALKMVDTVSDIIWHGAQVILEAFNEVTK